MKLKFKTAKESIDFCLQKYKDLNEYHQKLSELKKTWTEGTRFSPITKLSDEDFDFLVSSFVKTILKPTTTIPDNGNIEVKIRINGYTAISPVRFKGPGYFSKIRERPMIIIGWIGGDDDFFSQATPSHLAFVSFGICSEFIGIGIMKIQNPVIPIYRYSIVGYDAVDSLIRVFQKNIKADYKKKSEFVKHRKLKRTYHTFCENCQREFTAYRSDARSCGRVACNKALSRKRKIRQYKKKIKSSG